MRGRGTVAIYDPALIQRNGRFYFLQTGDRFDLRSRVAMRNGRQLYPILQLSNEELARYEGHYVSDDGSVIEVSSDGSRLTLRIGATSTTLTPISPRLFYGDDAGMEADFDIDGEGADSVRWSTSKGGVLATKTAGDGR